MKKNILDNFFTCISCISMLFITYFFSYFTNLSYLFTDPTISRYKKFITYLYYTYLLLHIPFYTWCDNLGVYFDNKKLRTKSFLNMFILYGETQVRREYYFHTQKKSPLILDLGANIGATALFFKNLYPDANLHCFEPDNSSFAQLKNNLGKMKNIVFNNAAVSNTDKGIAFYSDESASLANSQYELRGGNHKITVPSVMLSQYIKTHNIKKIDLFKMDIEGGEINVFEDMEKHHLFDLIDEMIIEYHHNIEGLDMSFADFLHLIEKNGFQYQLNTRYYPLTGKNIFQDIYIRAYKHV